MSLKFNTVFRDNVNSCAIPVSYPVFDAFIETTPDRAGTT
jgi:hypothetical protein